MFVIKSAFLLLAIAVICNATETVIENVPNIQNEPEPIVAPTDPRLNGMQPYLFNQVPSGYALTNQLPLNGIQSYSMNQPVGYETILPNQPLSNGVMTYLPNDPRTNITYQNYCIGNTGVTTEMISMYTPEGSMNEDINCYFHCIFTQAGYVSEDGRLLTDRFRNDAFSPNVNYECLENSGRIVDCKTISYLQECNL